jgi:thioredoxin 1
MALVHLNEDNFHEEVLESDELVLVDFWAEWCAPCRMLGPIIEELAEDVGEEYKIAKLNIEKAKSLAREYNVMSIPTMVLFKNGEEVKRVTGVKQKEQLKSLLEEHK